MVMHLGSYDWKSGSSSTKEEMEFCQKLTEWHFVTSAQLWNRKTLNVESLLRMERSQLRWFGHVTRKPQERSAMQILLATPTQKRPRGRLRTRCVIISPPLLGPLVWVEPAELSERVASRAELVSSGLNLSMFRACMQNFFSTTDTFVASYCWSNRVVLILNRNY